MGAICRGKTERERKNNVRDARMLCVLGFKILIMEWRRVLLLLRERERESGTREMGVFLGRYDSLRVVGISFLPKT